MQPFCGDFLFLCLLSCRVGVGLFSILRSVHMTGHGQPVMETSMQCGAGQVTGGTITTLQGGSSDTVNNLEKQEGVFHI